MARPQQVSDKQILEAAIQCIAAAGPAPTFAEIGALVGISAPAINRRVGNKRALMLRVVQFWSQTMTESFDLIGDGSPIARLAAGLKPRLATTPEALVNVMAGLYTYLDDPEFRDLIEHGQRGHRAAIRTLLDEAIAADELKACDTDELAWLLQMSIFWGARNSWSVEPNGELEAWCDRFLTAVLAPWLLR